MKQDGLEVDTKYLEEFRGPHTIYPDQTQPSDTEAARTIDQLSNIHGLNPLGFTSRMFARKEIPKLHDLITVSSEEVVDEGLDES